jgi:hypothetical protein
MSGSSQQYNQEGIYGVKGVPSQTNIPGARIGSNSWVDNEGSFWLFGGMGWLDSQECKATKKK